MPNLAPPYALPDLRPFRAIQNRMRLQGGAVVTQHGSLESDNFAAGTTGWQIDGEGDVEFNSGTFRGNLNSATIDIGGADATSFHVDANGNLWSGGAAFSTAPFKVANTGIVTVKSLTTGTGAHLEILDTDVQSINFFDGVTAGTKKIYGTYDGGLGGYIQLLSEVLGGATESYLNLFEDGHVDIGANFTGGLHVVGYMNIDKPALNANAYQLLAIRGRTSSAVVGSSPPAVNSTTGQLFLQAGTGVGTTDSNGQLTLTYPSAFPNGVLSVLVGNGDNSVGSDFWGSTSLGSTSSCTTIWRNHAGTLVASTSIRFNFIAVGW